MDSMQHPTPRRGEQALLLEPDLATLLRREVARAAGVPEGSIAPEKPLLSLGLDSLAVVELQYALEQELGVSIPLEEMLDGIDLAGLERLVSAALEDGRGSQESIAAAAEPAREQPLSAGQLALWLLQQVAGQSAPLHIAASARVRPQAGRRLDTAALRRGLEALAARHPVLLATFEELPGGVVQRFGSGRAPELVEVDATAWTEEEIAAWSEGEAYRPFDLATGPLLRVAVARRAGGEDAMVFTIHHIVADFWSVAQLVRDLSATYLGEPLAPLPVTYGDYLRWQAERLEAPEAERLWDWWREQLSPPPAILALPSDRLRPPVPSYRGGAVSLSLGPEVSAGLASLARHGDTTLFATVLAGFQAFLGRYSGQRDLVVGSPTAGRSRPELAGLAGYFVNLLALRADLSGDPAFTTLLEQARGRVLGALEHQELPLPLITERLLPERATAEAPLLQACLVLQKAQAAADAGLTAFALGARGGRIDFGGLSLESRELAERWSQFDLVLRMAEVGGSLVASLQYSIDLFDPATAGRMLGHLREFLAATAADPGQPLSALPLLTAAERLQLAEWNDTACEVAAGPWVHELVEEQARRTPEAPAVVDGDRQMTYGELSRRARRLAHTLRRLGVRPEVRVGVCLERSADLVVSCLAVLQAGGAYVALDPSHPEERLGFQLEDSAVPVVLTRRGPLAELAVERGIHCLFPQELEDEGEDGPLPAAPLEPDSLAYIIYTSGSTGRPKGAELRHGSVLNLMAWQTRLLGLGAEDRTTLLVGVGFDATILEIWPFLAAGASLYVVPDALRTSPGELLEWMADKGITAGFLPTALAEGILDLGWDGDEAPRTCLRLLIAGGDRLHRYVPASLPFQLVNGYGPTETTVLTTAGPVPAAGPEGRRGQMPSIGRPLPNVRLHVVEAGGEPRQVPVGVPGELLIGGTGLGRGYLRRPDLTAERFIPDPFAAVPGERLYRSGDLVRWSPDGEIEFLGRIDHQVKIRGQRIELGEIEAVLAEHPAVREAAVLALDGRLVAFIACAAGAAPAAAELREHARRQLPDHMVPSLVVPLAALPVNTSGKVDRHALAPLGREAAAAGSGTEPGVFQSPVEELIAGAWEEVLGRSPILREDNFFHLGGHSLLATRVLSRVGTALGVQVPARMLFEHPTVSSLAVAVAALRRQGEEIPVPPLVPMPRRDRLPLSATQRGIWFLDRLAPGSPAYNIPGAYRLRGTLEPAALAAALSEMVRRHEALRTRFVELDGEPRQEVLPARPVPLPLVDLGGLPAREAELARLSAEEAVRPFDLARGPLLRALLVRLDGGDHVLLPTLHHIVYDGWSEGVLATELTALYAAAVEARPAPLPEPPVQYADFTAWQQAWPPEVLGRQLDYWRGQLAGAPMALELPTDRPRPPVQSFRGGSRELRLPAEVAARLRLTARREGSTLYMLLMTCFATLLARYSRQEDLLIGTPVANRTRPELEGLIGLFVNTLALRVRLAGDPELRGLLAQVRDTALGAFAHQDLSFEALVEELRPERDLSRNPVVQVTLQSAQAAPPAGGGLLQLARLRSGVRSTAKFDLSVSVEELEDEGAGPGLALSVEYAVDLFTAATAARLLEHYANLLQGAAQAPDLPVSRLPLLSQPERHQLLAEWNDTGRAPAGGLWIHELVAAQARRAPEATAVVDGTRRVSYGELDGWARRITRALRGLGVGPEVRVGVCLERSADLLAACLGVLQAGGAYVALDPSHPDDRLSFQLADSAVPVLLTREGRVCELAAERGIRCLVPRDLEEGDPDDGLPELPAPVLQAGSLAYVIYTSGSTGRPKGADLSHGSLLNLVAWQTRLLGIGAADRTTLLVGVGYDATILEIWPYLAAGASLHIVPDALRTSPAELLAWMGEQGITASFLPTALVEEMLDLGFDGAPAAALRSVLTGGDRLHRYVPASLPFQLINAYGPTEATVVATAGRVPAGDRPGRQGQAPTIGRPLDNVSIHVADTAGGEPRPVPVGVPGELLVGGAGLARGYLSRPELTAERFVPDPFTPAPGGRLYRTGDLVRWSPEGEIEFLGRIDHQVKIRGQRIELGEIEAVLALHPAVREAAVLAVDGRLVAFLISRAPVAPAELREHARRQLPDVMVPASFLPLAAWPLNTSGKVDRHALAQMARQAAPSDDDAEPGALATPVQQMLADIWRELLEVGRVRLGDNFFELGGHSLKVTQLRSRIREAFGVDLPLQSFFEEQSLASQAEKVALMLREGGEAAGLPIAPIERGGDLQLSFAQQRLWFLDQLEPGTQLYNIPLVGELRGVLDVAALERSFGEIVRRHESLRTTFPETAMGAVQRIAPPHESRMPLPVVDVSGLPAAARAGELDRLALAEARRPWNLASGPLMRTILLRGGEQEHVLLICMHHIISDGWSTGVIVRELSAFYRGFVVGRPVALPAPALQYADFAAWQREWLTGEVFDKQMGYWRRQLAGLEVTELPTDRPRPAVETFRGTLLPAAFSLPMTDALRELARGSGATLYMVLLAAFDVLIASYTGRTDIAVGGAVANRNRRETEDVIGFFVNTLVMRTRLGGNPSLRELLGRVRETALAAYVHEDMPFERVVEDLQPQRDLSRNPLFQVMLVLQNIPLPPLDLPGLTVTPRQLDLGTVKFDMALVWWEEEGRLVGQLEYSTNLFDAPTMRRLLVHYETVLERALANPELPISALAGPTEAERHQIVEEWNDSRVAFGPGRCIHQWMEEAVALTPDALALVAGDEQLSYRELNAMANRLAHHLRRLGVGPDVLVGICVDRTWAMVVGLLGVLKAGGGALALDPTYPQERLRYMIHDARLALLIVEEKMQPLVPDTGIPRLRIDTDWPVIAAESDVNPVCDAHPESTMYAIYTSGSTGQPKGVLFTHSAFVNLLEWQFGHSRLARRARTVQYATFGFCVSFLEIFSVLCSGGTLVMVNEEYRRDMEALWQHLEANEVERLHLPFAALKQLADVCGEERRVPRHLREVVTSGEQLQIGRSIRSLFSNLQGCSLTNQYGTSEIHVVSSFRLPDGVGSWPDISPVGRPVANTQIYLLDAQMEPLPVGVLGEIYAGGACLARGYLGAPAQTAAKFVPDPFAARRGEPGARLYRTGDLARQLPDGRIEWFGRIDNQVRIRGFRVELGEVETAVKEHLGVRNAAVICRPGPGGGPRLIAYVVPHEGGAVPDDLRAFLKAKLPDQMVPAVYVAMPSLPLNANGKLDIDSFPDPETDLDPSSFVPPSGPVEEMVAHILAKVLNAPRVGAHDNFFEIGGHSLLATQVANRIRRNFAVDLPLRTFFEGPTVAELARAVVALEARPGRSEKIAQAFLKVQSLSGEELEQQLRSKRPGGAAGAGPAPAAGEMVETVVDLTPEEHEQTRRLRDSVSLDPDRDLESFVLAAKRVYREMPERIRRKLEAFGRNANTDGVLLLRGLAQDPVLPPTPTRSGVGTGKSTFASELWLCAVASAFGEPVGYQQEKQGKILQDIYPTPVNAGKQSSESSSVLLAFHTEIAFHPFMPDYVLLYGVRQDPYKEARTMFASVRHLVPLLSPEVRETLFASLFRTGIDYSFGNLAGERGSGPLVPVLYGDRNDPYLRYDLDLMVGETPEACHALEVVNDLVNRVKQDVVLEPGSLLVLDNRRCVHARSVFRALFDGTDRWIQRAAVVRDFAASAKDRAPGSRVIATDFSQYLSPAAPDQDRG